MRRTSIALFAIAATALLPLAADAQEPNYGRAVVMTETELYVGQPVNWYGPGTVYVYTLDGAGEWVESARLQASDPARMDDFGRSLALDGNTLVVGAPRKRDGSGVAYVFERGSAGATWQQAAVIEAPGGEHAEWAAAITLDGDELLVGAPRSGGTGQVHQFRRGSGGWTLQGELDPVGQAVTGFGQSLSRSGDQLVIGAPGGAGGAFVSTRQGDGTWGAPVALPVPGPQERAQAGAAVEIEADQALVGAPGAATVHAFQRDAGGAWTYQSDVNLGEPVRGSGFGAAMEIDGNGLWVGAPGLNGRTGAVYRYELSESGEWQRAAGSVEPQVPDSVPWPSEFGYSIAAAGDRAVIGMPQRDFGEGRVLAMQRRGSTWAGSLPNMQTLEGEIFRLGADLETGERCGEAEAIDEFPCRNIEIVSHLTVDDLGGERGVWVNDVWGWTDAQTGRDYALVARRDGAAFVDVTDPAAPRLVGNLPRTVGSPPSVWRDIKVYADHAFIVADGAGAHGMQVFDLTRLRAVGDTPVDFAPDATYDQVFSAHNVVADTESGFLYIVGAGGGGESCGGGLHIVDARQPKTPTFAGCYNDGGGANPRGYTHDAQCLTYRGPDAQYTGREICLASNERELNVADVTDKSNPVNISRASYPNVAYAHQGWFDEEHRYFYQNDETDELRGTIEGTRTIVWDLTDLDDPVLVNEYIGPVPASDHNLFVKGDLMYQSNYGSGLRVLDISDREAPREIAFFDSAPANDNGPGHSSAQSGAWSNYPFFESGVVIFTSVREGLFIVRVRRPVS